MTLSNIAVSAASTENGPSAAGSSVQSIALSVTVTSLTANGDVALKHTPNFECGTIAESLIGCTGGHGQSLRTEVFALPDLLNAWFLRRTRRSACRLTAEQPENPGHLAPCRCAVAVVSPSHRFGKLYRYFAESQPQ